MNTLFDNFYQNGGKSNGSVTSCELSPQVPIILGTQDGTDQCPNGRSSVPLHMMVEGRYLFFKTGQSVNLSVISFYFSYTFRMSG